MRNVSSRLGRTCSVRAGRQELQRESTVEQTEWTWQTMPSAINLNTCGHTRLEGKPYTYTFIQFSVCVCLRFERSELVLLSVFRSCSTYRWSLSITDWKWGHSFKTSAEKKSPNKRIAIHLKSSVILFEGFCQAVKHCSDF